MDKMSGVGPSEVDLLTAHAFHSIVERSKFTTKTDKPAIYSDYALQTSSLNLLEGDITTDQLGRSKLETVELVRDLVDKSEDVKLAAELRIKLAREELNARSDVLTELPNRRAFNETLKRMWAMADRNNEQFALMMIDANFFKKINDLYGNQAGDESLRIVAKALLEIVRAGDFVARYGGDEMIVLLPGSAEDWQDEVVGNDEGKNKTGNYSLLARINLRIKELLDARSDSKSWEWDTFDVKQGEIPLFVAAGVASYGEDEVGEPADLIGLADKRVKVYKTEKKARRE